MIHIRTARRTDAAGISRVHERTTDDFDTPVWLALIGGVTEDWQTCRTRLSAA